MGFCRIEGVCGSSELSGRGAGRGAPASVLELARGTEFSTGRADAFDPYLAPAGSDRRVYRIGLPFRPGHVRAEPAIVDARSRAASPGDHHIADGGRCANRNGLRSGLASPSR
jgi:hypothetical protein